MNKRKIIKIIGIFLIIFSLTITISSYFLKFHNEITESHLIEEFLTATKENVTNEDPLPLQMVIEIPKINLSKALYPLGSSENNVNKNIEIIQTSKMPNEPHSNLILAGHSGIAANAYFNNLDKLQIGDIVNIYYDKLYTYQINNIQEINKTGYMQVTKNPPTNQLILVTCKKTSTTTQVVYTAILISTKTITS